MFTYGLVDIDDFTTYNINYGFEKGNEILSTFEYVAQGILVPKIWKKLGSDEFIFVLEKSFLDNKQNILMILHKCKESLGITVSIGLSEQQFYYELEVVVNTLRVNLLTAKKYGKNKICLT